MKKLLLTLLIASTFVRGYAQNQDAIKYAATIHKQDLYGHLSILASDALEGRETGKRGQKMAAAYIRAYFQELGLIAPVDTKGGKSYFQEFDLENNQPGDTYFKIGKEKKSNGKNTLYWGRMNSDSEQTIKAVFVGEGDTATFTSMDVKGKAVVIQAKGEFDLLRQKRNYADEQGAAIVLMVNTDSQKDFDEFMDKWKGYFMRSSMNFATKDPITSGGLFFVSPENAAAVLNSSVDKINTALTDYKAGKKKALKKIKPGKFTYKTARGKKTIRTENVLGFLEGTDKKEEVVVITSHYDHIGKIGDKINNGADDDGSGTSSVLEIAEAFVKAKAAGKGPRRSILFMTVTGEEKGLLGSEYYSNHPVFPLENTVVDLNIDMIGRIDPEHEKNSNYVYLVGSDRLSTELHDLSEKANETFTQLDLDYTYNDESHPDRIYYRSDHWNFAKNNVPIIFYFNGTHADYHKPTDTIEKIEFELMAKRAQLVFHTAWVIANRDQRIVTDKIKDAKMENK